MDTSLDHIVRLYLDHNLSIHALREWLTLNEPELSVQEQDLADEVDVSLVHFYDGYAQESETRLRLAAALELPTIVVTKQPSWPVLKSPYRKIFASDPSITASTEAITAFVAV